MGPVLAVWLDIYGYFIEISVFLSKKASIFYQKPCYMRYFSTFVYRF